MLQKKYFDLQEPEYDHMVFINRREGLVPLSSLCKDDVKSVMSSNVKLLKGRNVRLGKPRIFVKDNGRLVAVGGSRGEIFIETKRTREHLYITYVMVFWGFLEPPTPLRKDIFIT